jgi:hypothetical protein
VVPEHDPVVLWDLLHSLYRQLDNIIEILLASWELFWVDILSLECGKE